jgi:hypothetical protein
MLTQDCIRLKALIKSGDFGILSPADLEGIMMINRDLFEKEVPRANGEGFVEMVKILPRMSQEDVISALRKARRV